MIPEHEVIALRALIRRLEATKPLTQLQVFQKGRAVHARPGSGLTREEVVRHIESRQPRTKLIFRDRKHPILGDTHYALGFHVRQLDSLFEDWLEGAHYPPPAHAGRIAALLRRAKMKDLLAQFEAAYRPHAESMSRPAFPLEPTGDEDLDFRRGRVSWLEVTIKSVAFDDKGASQFTFEFCCRDCGGYIMSCPDHPDMEGPALCKACGRVFGTEADVRRLAQYMANAAASGARGD